MWYMWMTSGECTLLWMLFVRKSQRRRHKLTFKLILFSHKLCWSLVLMNVFFVFSLQFNFVGRILGPRGMTAKQLEQETGCKIMVRGKGSMRDKKKVSKESLVRFCLRKVRNPAQITTLINVADVPYWLTLNLAWFWLLLKAAHTFELEFMLFSFLGLSGRTHEL